jgi:hypothetical protein
VTPPAPVATGTAVLSRVITSDQGSVASFTPKTSDDGKTPSLTTLVGKLSELYLFNSGQGIVINVKDVKLTYDALSSAAIGASTAVATVNGSVTGEFENGYVFSSQLLRGSGGVLAVAGAGEPSSQSLLYSQVGYLGSGADADQFHSLEIFTIGGALTVRRNQGVSAANQYFVNYQPADTHKPAFSGFATPAIYSETATDFTVNLNGLTLSTTSGTQLERGQTGWCGVRHG